MKRIATLVFAAGAALALNATAAQAQGVNFGVGAGATIPTGDAADFAKTGWNLVGSIGYQMASGLGLRGDFYYGQHSLDDSFGVDGKFKLSGGLGNVTYTFPSQASIRPYVIGTIGMMNSKFEDFDGETNVAFGGGAGIQFKAGSDANFFVEARYLVIKGDEDNTNLIPLTAGIRFGI